MIEKQKGEMTFLEHLEELRWHIIRSVLAITVFAVLAFIYKQILFDKIIMGPSNKEFWTNRKLCELGTMIHKPVLCINTKPIVLQNLEVSGQFTTSFKIAIIAGLILAFPYIFYELWRFVSPALYNTERKHARGAIFYISLLFILGILFGYFLITPLSVNFLTNYHISNLVKNNPTLGSYISLITSIVLASGILFELPVLVYFLGRIGIITPEFLKRYRRHAIVVILIVAGIITPPDIFSQIMVSIPLLLLYEVSIMIASRTKKQQELAKAGQ